MVESYKFFIIAGVSVIGIIGIVLGVSLTKGSIATQEYEIDVDPFKDPQNLFVTARVMIQNTGSKPLTNVLVNFGNGQKPFININCPAIQGTMYESELFGYESGAFTGADKRKHGLMEIADGGILFLDEISSIPVEIQVKLLRALQERTFRRVGGLNPIHVDVQIVAASNRDLQKMIADGTFREDLYYRLKVVNLHLPPLRERKEDIPELVGLFIRKFNQRMGINVVDMTPRAMEALMGYNWPGNIRELSNVIERAMLFCDEESIDLSHMPAEQTDQGKAAAINITSWAYPANLRDILD